MLCLAHRDLSRRLGVALFACALLAAPRAAQANCDTMPELCGLDVHSTIEQADFGRAVDIVLVGDGFTSVSDWHFHANRFINAFKNQTNAGIYQIVPELFNFHIVDLISQSADVENDNTDDTPLGMRSVGSEIIVAADYRVNVAALNAPDVDVVLAVANSSGGRANASLPNALMTGGAVRMNTKTGPLSHELAHALYNLRDEYVDSTNCRQKSEVQLYDSPNITADSACYKFATVDGAACYEGALFCRYDHYRAASSGLMRSGGNAAFGAVSLAHVESQTLERRTGLDLYAPWAVVAEPATGAVVAGTVEVRVRAWDHFLPLAQAALQVDDRWAAVAPFGASSASIEVDTRRFSEGLHVLQAVVWDEAGHWSVTAPIDLDVRNVSDTDTPTVEIAGPADGATVGTSFSVNARVTDYADDLERIVLYLDDEPVAIRLRSTSMLARLNNVSDGQHTLRVEARDHSQNVASAQIVVDVQDPSLGGGGGSSGNPSEPLHLYLSAPEKCGDLLEIEYSLSGANPGEAYALTLSSDQVADPIDVAVASAEEGGFLQGRSVVDVSTWSLGAHSLTLEAQGDSTSSFSNTESVVYEARAAEVFLEADTATYSRGTVDLTIFGYAAAGVEQVQLFAGETALASVATLPAVVALDTTLLTNECQTIEARLTDADSNVVSNASTFRLCVDNAPPTVSVSTPTAGEVLAEGVVGVYAQAEDEGSYPVFVELMVDGVSAGKDTGDRASLFAELPAGAYTLTVRTGDAAGNEALSSPVAVVVENCSTESCDDGLPCTVEVCAATGVCLRERTPSCCANDDDCSSDDACVSASCVNGTCVASTIADCCNTAMGCDDGDACTTDVCSGPGGSCSNASAGCCEGDVDCHQPQQCRTGTCVADLCAFEPIADCCVEDFECADEDVCTDDRCVNNACVNTLVADCCVVDDDCDDGDPCTDDRCDANQCLHATIEACMDDGEPVPGDPNDSEPGSGDGGNSTNDNASDDDPAATDSDGPVTRARSSLSCQSAQKTPMFLWLVVLAGLAFARKRGASCPRSPSAALSTRR